MEYRRVYGAFSRCGRARRMGQNRRSNHRALTEQAIRAQRVILPALIRLSLVGRVARQQSPTPFHQATTAYQSYSLSDPGAPSNGPSRQPFFLPCHPSKNAPLPTDGVPFERPILPKGQKVNAARAGTAVAIDGHSGSAQAGRGAWKVIGCSVAGWLNSMRQACRHNGGSPNDNV